MHAHENAGETPQRENQRANSAAIVGSPPRKPNDRPSASYRYSETLPSGSTILAEILKTAEFNQLFESYYNLIHIPVAIIDLEANVLFSSRWQRICMDYHRVHPETCKQCIESDTRIALQLTQGRTHAIYRCQNGLTDCASPIILDSHHVANVFVGQFFTEKPDLERFRRQAAKFGFDQKEYLEAVADVPVVAEERIPAILDLLEKMTRVVTSLSVERQHAVDDQARLQVILDTIPQGVFWKDLEGHYLGCNAAFAKIAGLDSPAAIVAKSDFDLPWPRADAEAYRADDQAVISGRKARLHFLETIQKHDGSRMVADTCKVPLIHSGSVLRGMLGICDDVTKRLEAEEFRSRLAAIVESSDDAIISKTLEGTITSWNRGAEKLFGFSANEMVGSPVTAIIPPERVDEEDGILRRVMNGETVEHYETVRVTKAGAALEVSVTISPLRDQTGNIIGASKIVRDITATKRAAAALRASEQRFRTLIECAPVAIGLGRDTRTIYVNQKYRELFRIPDSVDVIGTSLVDLWDPEYRAIIEERSRRRSCGEPAPTEYEGIAMRADGERFPAHVAVTIVDLPDGPAAVAFFVDLTDVRRAEQAVRQAEEEYRKIYENAIEGIYRTSPEGKALGANPALLRLLGYDSREQYLATVNDTAHQVWKIPDDRRRYLERLERDGTIRAFECELLRRNGLPIWVSLNSRRVCAPDGRTLYYEGFIEDITERKEAERRLRASEERYRRIVETAQEGVFMYDAEWTLEFCNRRFAEILGYTREELLGHPISTIILEPDRAAHEARKARQQVGTGGTYENAYRAKDGHSVWCLVSVSPIVKDGAFAGSFGMLTDISGRKDAERKMSEYQQRLHELTHRLQQIREDESLRIARVVHDELGQQLTGLKMDLRNIERALEQVEDRVAGPILETVLAATELLDATVATVQKVAADLRPSLLDKLGLFAALRHESEQFEKRSGVRCRFIGPDGDAKLPPQLGIACYRIVQECLTNIARHAHATNAEIRFVATSAEFELSVIDDGCGIAPDALRNMQSLGLLGMQERALPFGGEVTISPGKERGTVVRARLPRTPSTPSAP